MAKGKKPIARQEIVEIRVDLEDAIKKLDQMLGELNGPPAFDEILEVDSGDTLRKCPGWIRKFVRKFQSAYDERNTRLPASAENTRQNAPKNAKSAGRGRPKKPPKTP